MLWGNQTFICSDLSLVLQENSNEEEIYDVNEHGTSGFNINQQKKPKTNNYVAACCDRKWYITEVLGTSNDDTQGATYYCLKFTENKGENKFSWPTKSDEVPVLLEDILCVVSPPVPVSSRYTGLVEEDYKKVRKTLLQLSNKLCLSVLWKKMLILFKFFVRKFCQKHWRPCEQFQEAQKYVCAYVCMTSAQN